MNMPLFGRHLRALSAGAALGTLAAFVVPAYAATPADTLVEGFAIDDIISLDPGEAFEISTAEVTATVTRCWSVSTSTTPPR